MARLFRVQGSREASKPSQPAAVNTLTAPPSVAPSKPAVNSATTQTSTTPQSASSGAATNPLPAPLARTYAAAATQVTLREHEQRQDKKGKTGAHTKNDSEKKKKAGAQ